MKRLDPAWVPQVDVNVSGQVEHNFTAVKDVNIAVDYKQLSPSALKELLNSQKLLNERDTKSYKDENNESVVTKGLKNKIPKDPNKHYTSPQKKIRGVVDNNQRYVDSVRKQAKQEADSLLKQGD
jgi:hypothetical protein